MPEAREPRPLIDAAEKAAAAGDYTTAEAALREAALLQEAGLGPLHPDLANTLNNLGVVYEILDKPADAERCFRRAYAIATASLKPDHPFVATSKKNLRDFCDARGLPFELPPVPPPPAVAPSTLSRPYAIGGLAVALVLALLASRMWSSANRDVESPQSAATVEPFEPPAPAPSSAPATPVAEASNTVSTDTKPVAAELARPADSATSAPLTVLEANVCRDLSPNTWRCEPAGPSVTSGRLSFYTRVKSPTGTTVQHRWYRDDHLHQSVKLRIEANPGGYRTYSRTTVGAGSAGEWRVELRTSDGDLLHEERFHVP